MNFLSAAARLRRDATKMARGLQLMNPSLSDNDAYEQALTSHMTTLEEDMRIGCRLMLKFREIATEEGLAAMRKYFITIRPDTRKISFDEFYHLVQKFVTRKCFNTFELSFEQKGQSDDTLGDGFHVHIIADMRQRSKGEVLRDTKSTFSNCTAENCIQVDISQRPDGLKKYLIDYESKDGHKETTKEWDAKWRTLNNLQNFYEGELPPRISPLLGLSSPVGPTIIELS